MLPVARRVACACVAIVASLSAQDGPPGRPGAGGGPGPGGGGPMQQELKLVKRFDKNGDKRLDAAERKAARAAAKEERVQGGGRRRGPGGPGGPGGPMGGPGGMGPGRGVEPGKPGPKVEKQGAPAFPDAPLYAPDVLRTLFLDFADGDWEAELGDFYRTDVEVPATLTVDGKAYPDVGVRFRGASSYFTVPAGSKRSLNLALDHADPKQRLYGHKTLNLLNAHEDPSFLRTVLYFDVARDYIPAPKANFVRLVVNGESWGVYVSAQQFNREFIQERFQTTKGARFKVPGSPMGDGGLRDLGDDLEQYRRRFEFAGGADDDASWKALMQLCRTLDRTPPAQLEAALKPLLDVDGALWFLALENVLVNNDGYWTRASDYALYRDAKGVFHVLPHDANETFSPHAGGPGMGGPGGPGGGRGGRGGGPGGREGRGGGEGPERPRGGGEGPEGGPEAGGPAPRRGGRTPGHELDPLIGLDDERKPLRSKLLAAPALRAKYLANVRTLAEKRLDWSDLGPRVAAYRKLLADAVAADTRKLSSTEAFLAATADAPPSADAADPRGGASSLRAFADKRRAFLLNHPALKN
ncbi:MAG TPA: CotH kinase family protein [Planctomycetota bacterium]|nr:CotH kinase family protein [Planctomycetota bacterium]